MASDRRQWIETIGKIVVPILMMVFAFILVDSVENALKKESLEVESASAINELLNKLHGEVGQFEANAAALTLAAYGKAAIIPLIGTIEYGSPQAEAAAHRAIFMIGLDHPQQVTETLSGILAKRHRQFHVRVHQHAIVLLGAIAHKDAKKALLDYSKVIAPTASEGLDDWKNMVRGAKKENYKETQKEMKRALASFEIDWAASQ